MLTTTALSQYLPYYDTPMSVTERAREEMRQKSATFDPNDYDYENAQQHPPDLDRFYNSLENYTTMVTRGYTKLFMLDARGGLGKTYNIKRICKEELESEEHFHHMQGYTTPLELYKTLWKAQHEDTVLFLDDVSGITKATKAVDMLKAATDTEGEENWVSYRSSRDIEHPYREGETISQTFCFRGSIIMSFNDTPDNRHFDALKDRGTFYQLDFNYEERLELIRELAKLEHFSNLSVKQQQTTAEWIADVTDRSMEVSIRTFKEVCRMRHFGQEEGQNWETMALEVFNVNPEKYLILRMRNHSDMSVEEQVNYFKQETGYGQTKYYDLMSELKDDML